MDKYVENLIKSEENLCKNICTGEENCFANGLRSLLWFNTIKPRDHLENGLGVVPIDKCIFPPGGKKTGIYCLPKCVLHDSFHYFILCKKLKHHLVNSNEWKHILRMFLWSADTSMHVVLCVWNTRPYLVRMQCSSGGMRSVSSSWQLRADLPTAKNTKA